MNVERSDYRHLLLWKTFTLKVICDRNRVNGKKKETDRTLIEYILIFLYLLIILVHWKMYNILISIRWFDVMMIHNNGESWISIRNCTFYFPFAFHSFVFVFFFCLSLITFVVFILYRCHFRLLICFSFLLSIYYHHSYLILVV